MNFDGFQSLPPTPGDDEGNPTAYQLHSLRFVAKIALTLGHIALVVLLFPLSCLIWVAPVYSILTLLVNCRWVDDAFFRRKHIGLALACLLANASITLSILIVWLALILALTTGSDSWAFLRP